ncbi:MAG: methyltransferase domain-containing protein [Desulfobacterales bacterium]|nr:MAG: methyltransferase domain-containing protein [Desulfobacterales bacterium]
MDEISTKTQMLKIRNFEKGYMATHLINLGARLGIFEALNENKEGLTVEILAAKLGLHAPYLKIWCQSAYHFEILDGDKKGRYKLQPFLDEILGDQSHYRNYLANIAMDVDIIGTFFREALEPFRTGKPVEIYHTPEFSEIVYEPTKNIALAFLFMILPKNEHLKQKLEKGIRYLDIGCGNGSLIIQLAQAFTKSKFVGIGPDKFGIEAAESKIVELGLEKRVSLEVMGGENLPYEAQFDMASMVVTLHEIPPGVRKKAVSKAYQALKQGGHLLVLDFPYPNKLEDFRNPMYDYGVLDQFYEICAGTLHLTNAQQDELLSAAGFKDIQRMPIGKGMFDFITATK